MTRDELLLGIKDVRWSQCVTQDCIKTKADQERLTQEAGFSFVLTEAEMAKFLPNVPPEYIYYAPSSSCSSFYFNPGTLAACIIHARMFTDYPQYIEMTIKGIAAREEEVKKGKFSGSLSNLVDGLKMGYLEKLWHKKLLSHKEFRALFLNIYAKINYGFNRLPQDVMKEFFIDMSEEERALTMSELMHLPDTITVYRGGNTKSTPYDKAWSWSLDMNVAMFFAAKSGKGPGYIVRGTVRKQDVSEAFSLRGRWEQEVLISPEKVRIDEVITLYGIDECVEIVTNIAAVYQMFRLELDDLEFQHLSAIHGRSHTLRVLLHCLVMADLMNLSDSDTDALCWAALYHDTRRTHDGCEPGHGEAAAVYFVENCYEDDPVIELMIHYHSLPDEEGYHAIERTFISAESRERARLLFDVFKDADALDRIRLGGGLHEIDVNQFRTKTAIKLILLAKELYEEDEARGC